MEKRKKLRRRLLKARHSSKYFGTDIGVVLMTMNAGNIPFATNIIRPNEHESHYIYQAVSVVLYAFFSLTGNKKRSCPDP